MAQRSGVGMPGEAIHQWVAQNLDQAPPISPEQAATLSDLLADAREIE